MNRPSLLPSLPGTTPLPRALFVDRWGTLLEIPGAGHASHPDEVCFLPGALQSLFQASKAGWKIYLLGNEDAVARGELSEAAWRAVEERFLGDLARAGVLVARHYACLSHRDAPDGPQADSVYLLPNTGAFYHAAHTDGIQLAKSWVIGDSSLELVAGWRAGCHLAGVATGLGVADGTYHVDPDLLCRDLSEVIAGLLAESISLSA
jgi:histidinol phosphatase-like enzyme